MDVVPIPERKRHGFIRATADQLSILKNSFAISNTPTKEGLAAISDETGLFGLNQSTPKWISSWFMRERKKFNLSKTVHSVTAPRLSLQEITTFKQEHSDWPTLIETTPSDPESENKSSLIIKNVTKDVTQKSKKKSKVNPASKPKVSLGLLKSPFVSVPLVRRNQLPLLPPLIPTQTLDPVPATSKFMLRPMVPLMYQPQAPCSGISHSPQYSNMMFAPSPHGVNGNLIPMPIPTPATPPTVVIQRDTSTSCCNLNGFVKLQQKDRNFYPYNPYAHADGNSIDSTPQYSNLSSTSTSTVNQQAQNLRQDHCRTSYRPIRPLLPLVNPPQPQRLPAFCHSSNRKEPLGRPDKENYMPHQRPYAMQPPLTSIKISTPHSHAQTPVNPYTHSDLTNPAPHQPQEPDRHLPRTFAGQISPAVHPKSSSHSFFQQSSISEEQPASIFLKDGTVSTLLDPTTTPLKHLSVLAPFKFDGVTYDGMIGYLLDERLAQEDPFQAAMGLVFVSRLGLEWNSTGIGGIIL